MGALTVASGLNFPIRAGNLTVLLAASPEEAGGAVRELGLHDLRPSGDAPSPSGPR